MDVFLMVRRKKSTIFLDAKENTLVLELKKMIAGIMKRPPQEQRLFFKDDQLEDNRQLTEYGLNANTAKAQSPATVGLAFGENGIFESLDITTLSTPPELPDVMKTQEGATPSVPSD